MKLSEQLDRTFNAFDLYPGRNYEMSQDFVDSLISQVRKLESENEELKARLRGISQRAEDLQQAALEMEQTLAKLHFGG